MWSELGHAQLQHNNVAEAIAAYLRANDSSRCVARSKMYSYIRTTFANFVF